MSSIYEFCPEHVQEAYTKEQVQRMQDFGYDPDTIEYNALVKLRRPLSLRASSIYSGLTMNNANNMNNMNITASHQPYVVNNYSNTTMSNPFVFPMGYPSQFNYQQPNLPHFPVQYGCLPYQQLSMPIPMPYAQPPIVLGQQNFFGPVEYNPQSFMFEGNQSGYSTDLSGSTQSQCLTPEVDTMEFSTTNESIYNNYFTAPEAATEQSETQSNLEPIGPTLSDNLLEIDPQLVSDDFTLDPAFLGMIDEYFKDHCNESIQKD